MRYINHNRRILAVLKYISLLLIVIFGSLPISVSALDIDFYQSNDILFYDPDGSAQCTTSGTTHGSNTDTPILSGSDNAEKIWNFLKQEGFSDEQAAGVMGNIKQESGYDPNLTEGNGIGYGIIQWSFERRVALENAAKAENKDVSDLGFQLAYLKQEAQSNPLFDWHNLFSNFGVTSSDNVWDALKKQTTVERATTFFHDGFERSGDYENVGNIQHRINYANEAFTQFTGKSPSGGGGAAGSTGCTQGSAAGSGDLIATLLEYAHSTHTPYAGDNRVNPEPKPAYQEVATKLQKEGKWVGGGNISGGKQPSNPFPGIDCGGFVSILLTQSGFEPDYNFGLDMDRGSSNQEYGQLPWAKRNWKFLGYGADINVSDLQPGDVAYSNGHTFVYVGQVNGFESVYASASYDLWRAPMAGGTYETATSPSYVWYGRREGTPPAYGTTKMSDPIPSGNDINPGNNQQGRDW